MNNAISMAGECLFIYKIIGGFDLKGKIKREYQKVFP